MTNQRFYEISEEYISKILEKLDVSEDKKDLIKKEIFSKKGNSLSTSFQIQPKSVSHPPTKFIDKKEDRPKKDIINSQTSHEELLRENEMLKKKLISANKQIDSLEDDKRLLKKRIDDLEDQIVDLNKKQNKKSQTNEKDSLNKKQDGDDLKNAYSLIEKMKKQDAQNKLENENLKSKITSLENEIKEWGRKYDTLINKYNSLKSANTTTINTSVIKNNYSVKCALFMAEIYDQIGLYQDMINLIKIVIDNKSILDSNERNIFSIAYKNAISERFNPLRLICAIIDEEQKKCNKKHVEMLLQYKKTILDELEKFCFEAISIFNKKLLIAIIDNESRVFYIKMKADYYKYICEFKPEFISKSKKFYEEALIIAQTKIKPFMPLYLELILNYSDFLYDIAGQKQKAIDLSKKAFNDGSIAVDENSDGSYSETTIILQLLQDHISLWTSGSI